MNCRQWINLINRLAEREHFCLNEKYPLFDTKNVDEPEVIQCYKLNCKTDNCDNIVQTLNFFEQSKAGHIDHTYFD